MTLQQIELEILRYPAEDRLRLARLLLDSVIEKPDAPTEKPTVENDDFFDAVGLWQGRDITQTSLRQQAWRRPSA